ncbi:MAG TPA: alkaline phosphatase family protein [Trebonia sp.]
MKRQILAGASRPRRTSTAGAGTVLRALLPGCLALAGCLLAAGCGTSPAASPSAGAARSAPATDAPSAGATPTGGGGTAHPASGLGSLRKIVVIMEENHSLQQAFPSGMPYLWSLARQYGYATDWTDIGHPSLPNYLAIFAGSAFNDPQDCAPESGCTYPGPTVFGQALALGETAKGYEESMPQPCATGYAGDYDVNHNPWAYFPSEAASCRANDVPAGTPDSGALASDVRDGKLPTVGLITPNLMHDGHNGTLAQADAWLRSWIPVLMSGPDWRGGKLAIVVVFDEGETTEQVPAVFMAPGLSGATVSAPANHYALTLLIDEFIGARPLRQAGDAANVAHSLGLGR